MGTAHSHILSSNPDILFCASFAKFAFVVIRKVPVESVRLLSHHEDHEGREGKFSHPLFVIFVPFVVVRALLGLYA
jgi:hypothetical protein